MSSTIHGKRQIVTHNDDINEDDGGDVVGVPVPVGEQLENSYSQEVLTLIYHGVTCLLTFL